MIILFLLFAYSITLFLTISFLLHFTVKTIFKIRKAKYTTAIKINAILLSISILYGIVFFFLYLNWADIKSINDIIIFFFHLIYLIKPANILLGEALIFFALIIFDLLLIKYYSLKSLKNAGVVIVTSILCFIWFLVFSVPMNHFAAYHFSMNGSSMEPTLENDEYLIVKIYDTNYQKGDIIVFRSPEKQNQYLIQRIVGLPDEKLQIQNDIIELGANEYFVLGDNRKKSLKDSRHLGPIQKNLIVGKYWFSPFRDVE